MERCIVCQMAAGQMEGAIPYRDEHVITIMDHNPVNPGHILICPIQHHTDFDNVPAPLMGHVLAVARNLYQILKEAYGPDGLSFMQNNGHFNELKHYHLHLFPRYKTDSFRMVAKEPAIMSVAELRREMDGLKIDSPLGCAN